MALTVLRGQSRGAELSTVADAGAAYSSSVTVLPRACADPITVIEAGLVDYQRAWDTQRALAQTRLDGGPDTIMFLEHPPVFTAGKRTQPADRPTDGTPVIDVDRGGRITWHGPGQLVGYPIVALAEPVDVVGYVRLLEQALITACAQVGVSTGRVPGRSGVWLAADNGRPERKVAAIGVRIARGITQHGFALNCNNTMEPYRQIVPCGITDAGVSSLSTELNRDVPVSEMLPLVRCYLLAALDGELPVQDADIVRQEPVPGLSLHLDPAIT